MDIITVVVVLVLIAIFFGSVVWMEIYSRKTSFKGHRRDTKDYELNETEMTGRYSAFPTFRRYQAATSKTRAEEKS